MKIRDYLAAAWHDYQFHRWSDHATWAQIHKRRAEGHARHHRDEWLGIKGYLDRQEQKTMRVD